MEYTIDVEHHVTANLADCWTWEVIGSAREVVAGGHSYVDEATARKCAQAVIDALSTQPTTPTDARYYIQNRRAPYVGNSVVLWRDGGGYTINVAEAEAFTLADAVDICDGIHNEDRPLLRSAVDGVLRRHLDGQDMHLVVAETERAQAIADGGT